MPKLPRIQAKQIIVILERIGFFCVRQSGSHRIFRNAAGRRATVPFHGNKTLHPKVIKSILKDAELTPRDLLKMLWHKTSKRSR